MLKGLEKQSTNALSTVLIHDQKEAAFKKHFDTQKRYYGPQLVINLVNKKGYEAPMGAAFSKQIDILNDPQIKYHHFDFHHECSKMKWHRVSLLLDHFHSDLVAQGYVPPLLLRCSHSRSLSVYKLCSI